MDKGAKSTPLLMQQARLIDGQQVELAAPAKYRLSPPIGHTDKLELAPSESLSALAGSGWRQCELRVRTIKREHLLCRTTLTVVTWPLAVSAATCVSCKICERQITSSACCLSMVKLEVQRQRVGISRVDLCG